MNKILKQFDFQENSINEKERSVIIYASTKDKDRYGDIIQPSAFDVKKINEKSIPILFNHNSNLPIGKSLWGKVNDVGLLLKVYISDKTQVAKDVWELVKEKVISGASVGFMPLKYSELEDGTGYEFTSVDLIETSLTPVPANPNAIALMMKKVESDEMKELLDRQYLKSEIDIIKTSLSGFDEIFDKFKSDIENSLTKNDNEKLTEKLTELETSVKVSDNIVNNFSKDITEIKSLIQNHKTWVTERLFEIAGKIKTAQTLTPSDVEKIVAGAIRRHTGKLPD